MPLKSRHLRIVRSPTGPKTEYRYYEKYKCGIFKLSDCWEERIMNDFDLTKDEDIRKLNDMGFELSVRERP